MMWIGSSSCGVAIGFLGFRQTNGDSVPAHFREHYQPFEFGNPSHADALGFFEGVNLALEQVGQSEGTGEGLAVFCLLGDHQGCLESVSLPVAGRFLRLWQQPCWSSF